VISEALEVRGVHPPSWAELRAEYDGKRREFDSKRREFDSKRREFDPRESVVNPRTLAFDWERFTDVWTFDPVSPQKSGRHLCEKPAGLIAHLVETMSRPGDLVLDPFAGSGVTADVCRRLDRSFVGVELDESWCASAVRRLDQGVFAL
jgi:site-specific DNA-methyltransferase (adenine-specific)